MTNAISFLGVDLGTVTNQASDINETGRAQPIRLPDGDTSMLAVVFFDADNTPVFGQEAENLRLLDPSRGVAFAKRDMGSPKALITIDGTPYTAEDLATLQLEHIKDHIEKERNRLFEGVVVTVPANCEDAAKAAVIRAAKRAGFTEVVLKHEPTAALVSRLNDPDKKIADGFYYAADIGGGTTDFTMLERRGNDISVKTTRGVNRLGGVDFTQTLFDHSITEAGKQGVIIPETDLEDRAELWRRCEDAKRRLNRADQVTIIVIHGGDRVPVAIDKAKARTLWRHLVDQLIACAQETIKESQVDLANVLELLPIGGGSENFFVHEELTKFFGRKISDHGERTHAVALGAALLGWEHFKVVQVDGGRFLPSRGLRVKDVTAHAIGVSALDEQQRPVFAIVLEKGVPMGSTHRRVFELSEAGATSVVIEVLQGQPDAAVEVCSLLGQFELTGLPPVHGQPHRVELVFEVTDSGLITATARDTESPQVGDLEVTYDRQQVA